MASSLLPLGQLQSTTLATAVGPSRIQHVTADAAVELAADMVSHAGAANINVTLPPLRLFNRNGPLRNVGKTYIFRRAGVGELRVVPAPGDALNGSSERSVSEVVHIAVIETSAGLVWAVTASEGSSGATVIRQQSDLGEPVNAVITVTDGTYNLANSIDIDPGVELVFDATTSSSVCLRSSGPHIQIRGNVSSGSAFVTFPNQGVVNDISIVNNGTGDVVEVSARTNNAADSNANFFFAYDCNLASPLAVPSPSAAILRIRGNDDGRFPTRVKLNNCNIGSFATEGSVVLQDGEIDFIDIVGTLIPAPTAPSLLMAANFDGMRFGGSLVNGTVGAVPGTPAITLTAGGTILVPGATRLLLIQGVNVAGTLSGFDERDSDVLLLTNQGIRNSLFVGEGAFTGNALTTALAGGLFSPVNGTLVEGPEQQRFVLATNEFTYQGLETRDCTVRWAASFTSSSGNNLYALQVERRPDGGSWAAIANSTMGAEGTNRLNSSSGFASLAVDPLDSIRITVANTENNTDVVVNTLMVRIDAT